MQSSFSSKSIIEKKGGSKISLGILSICIGSLLFIACGGSDSDEDEGGGLVVQQDAGIPQGDAGVQESDAGQQVEIEGFIAIPAGSFTLDHATGSHALGDSLTLSAFSLKKTPVTVAEFEKCVAAKKCTSEHYKTVSDDDYCNYNRGDKWKNHPMNCIDWNGAKEYCEWIGGRLPTEDEWEYASTHNGTAHLDTAYPWGDDAPTHCVTAQYWGRITEKYCQGNTAAPMSNVDDYEGTSDVSLHSPAGDSPRGLVDMSGNVWEWTSSLYESGSSDYTLKGGSWDDSEDYLSVLRRLRGTRWETYTGVRCAK